jgi:hypothetical protein
VAPLSRVTFVSALHSAVKEPLQDGAVLDCLGMSVWFHRPLKAEDRRQGGRLV